MINKRAVSPLIATVLLIAFSVALGAVVMSWGRSFIQTQQETAEDSTSSEVTCSLDVGMDFVRLDGFDLVCFDNATSPAGVGYVQMTINNVGKVDISGVRTQIIYNDGEIQNNESTVPLSPGQGGRVTVNFEPVGSGLTSVDHVLITPLIQRSATSTPELCSNIKLEKSNLDVCS